MKLHQLLELRERAVLRAVTLSLDVNEQQQAEINKVALAAAKNWDENNLASIVGSQTARRLMEQELVTMGAKGPGGVTMKGQQS
ncbi:hypothetical protein BamMEX5DRAFT_1102 [Burkholderia ambifaria MEX-5]|uniref:Uncharacterized protein n=2 Tax=Burkholderia ambifaria TaxID=152480 RepID=B1SZY6_9BURK|nr:hypothetical protein BamMEX5DRAFT_1102 [Burkholderia ambifaria MEX-5]